MPFLLRHFVVAMLISTRIYLGARQSCVSVDVERRKGVGNGPPAMSGALAAAPAGAAGASFGPDFVVTVRKVIVLRGGNRLP